MERIDYRRLGHEGYQLLGQLNQIVKKGTLGQELLELVLLRTSQINHCAFCVNMHSNILRKAGVAEQRIQSVVVWEEAGCYSPREEAALAWAEAVALVSEGGVPDAVYERARAQFSEQELVDLTFALGVINFHNRLAVAFRRPVGS